MKRRAKKPLHSLPRYRLSRDRADSVADDVPDEGKGKREGGNKVFGAMTLLVWSQLRIGGGEKEKRPVRADYSSPCLASLQAQNEKKIFRGDQVADYANIDYSDFYARSSQGRGRGGGKKKNGSNGPHNRHRRHFSTR